MHNELITKQARKASNFQNSTPLTFTQTVKAEIRGTYVTKNQ